MRRHFVSVTSILLAGIAAAIWFILIHHLRDNQHCVRPLSNRKIQYVIGSGSVKKFEETRNIPTNGSVYQYLTEAGCSASQQNSQNGYLLYNCSDRSYCRAYGPGMVDTIKGAAMAYLISVALDKPFAMDLNLPCNRFEDVFDENCVKWKENRNKIAGIKDWAVVIVMSTVHGKKFLPVLSTTDLSNITGVVNAKNIEFAGNARFLEMLIKNPIYSDKLSKFLKLGQDTTITYQSVAEAILPRMFKIKKSYDTYITSQLANRKGTGTQGLICGQFRLLERNKDPKKNRRPFCNTTCVDRALKHMQNRGAMYDRATYFIASDTSEVLRRFTETCPNCDVMMMPGSHGHTGRDRKSCEGEIKAVWDLAFLMQCDTLLLSRNSFFGKITHYMRRNKTQDVCFINAKVQGGACYTDPEFLSNSE